jgi:hypothetical protein
MKKSGRAHRHRHKKALPAWAKTMLDKATNCFTILRLLTSHDEIGVGNNSIIINLLGNILSVSCMYIRF